MRRIRDTSAYEIHEAALAKALVGAIRSDLELAGLKGNALKTAVESVAFSVAEIYDGSAHVEVADDHLVPILGFAMGRLRNQLLIPEEGGSSVHEFIPGAVSAEFSR